ncbi:MAG: hypothetical protein ACR2O4_10415 [Hyphomicrobiaceae bacterium]
MRRIALTVLAVFCIIAGAITLPLPLPTGLVLLATGFALLLVVSRRARIWFRGYRRRTPWLDHHIARVEGHLPEEMRRALNGRRPRQQTGE